MRPFHAVRRMFAGGTGHGADGSLTPKSSAVGGLGETRGVWLTAPGAASWSGRRYDRFAEEGYRRNVIAHRCVRLVAEGAASMPWLLYEGEREVREHPLLDLLGRPNPLQGGTGLLENLYGFLLIAGNGWLEAVENARGQVAELYALRPDRMTVVPGPRGWPRAYKYSVGGESHLFEHDPARGIAPILHLKAFHPLDDHSGLSAFEPAAYAIDLHNESAAWNKALLDNAARPSGALVYDPGEKGGTLTEAQFARLKAEMEAQFQGRENAGRPMLLEGGLSWQQLGFSPSDMDFINAKHVSAREIALAFGVPPMLLGIPGDNTYANYQEANRALWRQTILPMAAKLTAALNAWLAPRFGEGLRLDFDTDAVEALAADRAQTWAQVGAASFLTVNEKRSALGYGPIAGGDMLQPAVAEPFMAKGLQIKGVREERAARYADLLKEHEVAVEAGSTTKTWKTAGDGHVRHSHAEMDGVIIPIDDEFEVGGERLFLPGDPSAALEETANCRCYVAYGVDNFRNEDVIDVPIVNDAVARKVSILNNTPAVFDVENNPKADGSKPVFELHEYSEVGRNEKLIVREAKDQDIDPDLVRAIMYMETTHGWYDRFVPGNRTIRPMNIHAEYWEKLGWSRDDLEKPEINIRAGVTLIKRIGERVSNPTIEKIATVYNYLGAHEVSDYGARVAKIYEGRLWKNE